VAVLKRVGCLLGELSKMQDGCERSGYRSESVPRDMNQIIEGRMTMI
jgi:hypothetical protein